MSYETDRMIALKNALRETDGLKYVIKEFNKNAKTLERIAETIEKNELKEREIELLERELEFLEHLNQEISNIMKK